MIYINESLGNVNRDRAEYVRSISNGTVEPFQRASDLIEVIDNPVAREWIAANGLTVISTSVAQTIYDGHVAKGDEEARTLT